MCLEKNLRTARDIRLDITASPAEATCKYEVKSDHISYLGIL